jgi:glycosyltransferase involved in cell wall biosynthesis
MPRVSIVVPTYNFANFIGQTIESVLDQSLEDFELLVFDNASTDNTREVLGQFDDPRVQYTCNEQNLGMYPSVTRAFGVARGEYLVIVGADDILERDFLERAVERLDREPQLSMVHGSAIWIDEQGVPFGALTPGWQATTAGEAAITDMFRYGFCLTTMVVRARLAKSLMPFNREWEDLADAWYFMNLCFLGDIGFFEEPLVRYRVHQRSLTVTQSRTGEFFEKQLRLTKLAFESPELKERGLDRLHRPALNAVARESIRQLHVTRVAHSRLHYLRSFGRILWVAPGISLEPQTWARFAFGMLPSSAIRKAQQWKRGRWKNRAVAVSRPTCDSPVEEVRA